MQREEEAAGAGRLAINYRRSPHAARRHCHVSSGRDRVLLPGGDGSGGGLAATAMTGVTRLLAENGWHGHVLMPVGIQLREKGHCCIGETASGRSRRLRFRRCNSVPSASDPEKTPFDKSRKVLQNAQMRRVEARDVD